jgi:hypothetical protein
MAAKIVGDGSQYGWNECDSEGTFLLIGLGPKGQGFKAVFKLNPSMPRALNLAAANLTMPNSRLLHLPKISRPAESLFCLQAGY